MAEEIMRMDTVIRMINDEENDIFEGWITEYVADGDKIDDVMDYADFESFYRDPADILPEIFPP